MKALLYFLNIINYEQICLILITQHFNHVLRVKYLDIEVFVEKEGFYFH